MTLTPKNQANPAFFMPPAQTLPTTHADPARAGNVIAGTPDTELEKQAKTLIGTTFFAQMLKQMRDSPFKSDLFDGGRGGQAFASMYDQQLAARMAQRLGDRMVRPIVKKFAGQADAAYAKQRKEATHVAHDQRA